MEKLLQGALVFLVALVFTSCSKEETATQENPANRPTVPITASELRIGNQVWMSMNLNVTRYRNGDLIPQVTDPVQWANLTTGAWCYYNNDSANGRIYGKLYNWYALSDPRRLAPVGWHVPSDDEWGDLITFLGGVASAGGKLKSISDLWGSPNTGATNSTGFTGLPGGYRNENGLFEKFGYYGYWWSSRNWNASFAFGRTLSYNNEGVGYFNLNWKNGFSVRCIKD